MTVILINIIYKKKPNITHTGTAIWNPYFQIYDVSNLTISNSRAGIHLFRERSVNAFNGNHNHFTFMFGSFSEFYNL